MRCSACNTNNRRDARFCRACGGILERPKQTGFIRCPKCGAKMEVNATHCPLCQKPQLRANRFALHKYDAEYARRKHTGYLLIPIAVCDLLLVVLCAAVFLVLRTTLQLRYSIAVLLGGLALIDLIFLLDHVFKAPVDAGDRTVFVEDTKTSSLYMITFSRRQMRGMGMCGSDGSPSDAALETKRFDGLVTDAVREYIAGTSREEGKRQTAHGALASVTHLPRCHIEQIDGKRASIRRSGPMLVLCYDAEGATGKRRRRKIRNAFPTLLP